FVGTRGRKVPSLITSRPIRVTGSQCDGVVSEPITWSVMGLMDTGMIFLLRSTADASGPHAAEKQNRGCCSGYLALGQRLVEPPASGTSRPGGRTPSSAAAATSAAAGVAPGTAAAGAHDKRRAGRERALALPERAMPLWVSL